MRLSQSDELIPQAIATARELGQYSPPAYAATKRQLHQWPGPLIDAGAEVDTQSSGELDDGGDPQAASPDFSSPWPAAAEGCVRRSIHEAERRCDRFHRHHLGP